MWAGYLLWNWVSTLPELGSPLRELGSCPLELGMWAVYPPFRQMEPEMWAVYLPLPADDTGNVGSLSPLSDGCSRKCGRFILLRIGFVTPGTGFRPV